MSQNNQKQFNSFEDFTNLYELSKTLRFELKPVGKTKNLIEEQRVFQKDKLIDDNYHKIKYYLDCLHRKFIKETLEATNLDLNSYYQKFLNLKKDDQKSITDFRDEENKLRGNVVEKFQETARQWKKFYAQKGIVLKSEGDKIIEILFEKNNLEILKEEFKEKLADDIKAPDINFLNLLTNKTENLFESFKGFTTYFSNFNNSRRNFYVEKDKDTAVANRAINENLRRFCDNIKLLKEKQNVYEKIELSDEDKKIFEINYYNSCLTQNGIKKYNGVIGRKSKKEKKGEKGLNQKINEYYQTTKEKLPLFKKLDSQIMGEKEKVDRFIEITNDKQAFEILKEFIKENEKKIEQAKTLFLNFIDSQLVDSQEYEIDKIYLKKSAINTISRKFFGENFAYFENALPHKETSSKEEKYKLDDFISIQQIKDALLGNKIELPKKWRYLNKIEMSPENLFKENYKNIIAENNWLTFLKVWRSEFENLLDDEKDKNKIKNESYKYRKEEIEREIIASGHLDKARIVRQEKTSDGKVIDINETSIIKMYVDSALSIFQMMKYFALEKGRKKIVDLASDDKFYETFGEYANDYNIIACYNEFRNYLTKKDFLGRLLFPVVSGERDQKHPLSKRRIDGAEKIKLNFDISHDHKWNSLVFLFRKDGKYYVGVAKKGEKIKFQRDKNDKGFEKMEYKQLKFKTLVGKGYIRDYKYKYSEQDDKIAITNAKLLIKKQYLEQYPLLNEVLATDYQSKKDFGKHVSGLLDASYSAEFLPIKENIFELNESGDVYLFQVNNKDFRTVGTPNLHTRYFQLLFDQPVPAKLKLNSEIELFFRPMTENIPIREKNGKKLTFIDKRDNNKEKGVLQNRRYGEDKCFLHLSVIQNFGKEKVKNIKGFSKKFNSDFNERVLNNNFNIIGIDRGENHLAYYSVIDQSGKIIDNNSFNKIDVLDKKENIIKTVDYLKLLEEKAGNRDAARKSWQTIENIKELKNGYISQVVRKICDLILKHNAIVVFEDLSGGFKRSRTKIEKQVYQKLELALVKKLNYLVNKNTQEGTAGHYLNAYQLTPPVKTYDDIGKQTGIVFYTQAGYTSKTCPVCGYRKNIGFAFYFENEKRAVETISKLKRFEYNNSKNCFEIEYSIDDFVRENNKGNKKSKNKENELYLKTDKKDKFVISSANVIRYKWHNRQTERAKTLKAGEEFILGEKERETAKGAVKKYNITKCLAGLFERNNIDYKNGNLQNKIKNLKASFYKDLFYLLGLMLDTRNSISGEDTDIIQCPECGFNSDNIEQFKNQKYVGSNQDNFVYNGDANGAYNIARKGIMILEKIKQYAKNNNGNVEGISYGDLAVNIGEWDKYSQVIDRGVK